MGLQHPLRPAVAAVILLVTAVLAGCSSHSHTTVSPSASAPASASASSSGVQAQGATFQGRKLPVFDAPPAPSQPLVIPTSGPTARIYSRIPVHEKVAFLTMDDGQTQLPVDPQLMKIAHIPFTMFLIAPVAAKNPAFFKAMEVDGGHIEDHTLTHPSMRGLSYARQKHEICGAGTSLESTFGVKMRFFRPPYGNYDQNTLRAVHDCGLEAAFNWAETVNYGKVFYQTPTHRIQPGDIILMHFRPAFVRDVIAALTAIHNAGLTPALLENYLH